MTSSSTFATLPLIACVQTNSQNNIKANLSQTLELIDHAYQQGARCITLPENVAYMAKDKEELLTHRFTQATHPALKAFRKKAAKLGAWILVGSLAIQQGKDGKLLNRSFLISAQGEIIERYTKIHLYDASVTGGESHQESQHFKAGNKASVVTTPFGKLGMTICYDLRFPHLYRLLAQKGAELITVPSAFTYHTGLAHWHSLLQARAIETSSYIIAPAQTGYHPSGRRTFGHSMIVDPWGKILAEADDKPGVIMAPIDLAYVASVRQQLPSLELNTAFKITRNS